MSLPSTSWLLLAAPDAAAENLARQTSNIANGLDWAIDLNTGDLIFPLRYTTGVEAVAQAIRIRLLVCRGEWFLDLDNGVPYLAREGVPATSAILGQKFDRLKALAAFRAAILDAPGVTPEGLTKLAVEYDGATRTMSLSFEVVTAYGRIIVSELELN